MSLNDLSARAIPVSGPAPHGVVCKKTDLKVSKSTRYESQ